MIVRGLSGEAGPPGEVLDLGWSKNLKTTVGMDWLHNSMGGNVAATLGGATSITANSVTKTAAGWTTDAFKGMRVVMPVTNITTEPAIGNILSNSATVLTLDQWWTAIDGTASTPAGTNAMLLLPGQGPARFMAITNDATAPAVGDTTLTSEITANACGRAIATYAHTPGATTYTQVKTWTASGAQSAQQAGLFTGGYGAGGGGILVAHTTFTSATLANGDSLQLTWTWTLPAAG